MNNPAIQHVGVVIQSLAIAVAFTVFLGRIYLLNYYEALRIPVSEVQLSIIDYAIASPAIAIFGVGLFIIAIAAPLWHKTKTFQDLNLTFRLVWGGFFVVLGVVLMYILAEYLVLDLVFRVIYFVIVLALFMFGGSLLGSSMGAVFPEDDTENSVESWVVERILIVVHVVVMAVFGIYFAFSLADSDASVTLRTAPQAKVEVASGNMSDLQDFRVILINDRFIYLQSNDEDQGLQAVPISGVDRIVYVNE